MNFYDTRKILALLAEHGYGHSDNPKEADFIAVNTCSVRQHAEDRALAFLSSHIPLKREGKFLCLFGCAANLHGPDILKKYGHIDIVCGAGNYRKLPGILDAAKKKTCVSGENSQPFIESPIKTGNDISEFVTVTKGCENFCSYCVVPFTRGTLVSKNPGAIYNEITGLAQQGVKEIILLGQNVNEYRGYDGTTFARLLEKIHDIDGIVRIWFLTSHPKDIPDELLACFVKFPRLYKHLHLPLQSGSDRILKLMNRHYTFERYMQVVDKIRRLNTDISITSDIITGFPSETDEDFQNTVSAISSIGFDDLFVFKYSERPGTAAAVMHDDVPQEVKEMRHRRILELQEGISLKNNQRFTKMKDNVFVIKRSGKRKGFFMGRSSSNKSVLFESATSIPGTLETITINSADRRYLYGAVCGENDR